LPIPDRQLMRSRVLLPAPLTPTIAVLSPRAIWKLTSRKTSSGAVVFGQTADGDDRHVMFSCLLRDVRQRLRGCSCHKNRSGGVSGMIITKLQRQ
jgi:hypothetical protein